MEQQEKKDGYEVITVKVQEEWKKGEKPPVGIRQCVDKEGNALDFSEVRVPKGVKIGDVYVGNATFTVPNNCVKDIDPTHENAKDYEKEPGFAESHKRIIAGKDFELTFKGSKKNQETGEYEPTEFKSTMGEYKKALKTWKKKGDEYREAKRDALKENKEIGEAEKKEPAKQVDAR